MSSSPSRIGISGQARAAVKAAPFLRAGGCLDSGPGLPYRYDEEGEGAYPECVIRRGRRRLPRQRFSSMAEIGVVCSLWLYVPVLVILNACALRRLRRGG